MKFKVFLFFLFAFATFNAVAQNITKAVFKVSSSASSPLKMIDITIGKIEFSIDGDGNVYAANPIDGGKYDYWTNDSFGNRDGKVKSIGNIDVGYWINDSYGNRDGKLKSVGDIAVDYWTNDSFGNRDGKLKSIGNIAIDYWTNDSYGNRTGKLKSIGNIDIDYWINDSFGNRDGKIKSISGEMPNIYVYAMGN